MQYLACSTTNSTKFKELAQNWLNLRMTSSQSIQAYWNKATRLLKDPMSNQEQPNCCSTCHICSYLAPYHQWALQISFWCLKKKMDGNIMDESTVLTHLIEFEEEVGWKPTDVAFASQSHINEVLIVEAMQLSDGIARPPRVVPIDLYVATSGFEAAATCSFVTTDDQIGNPSS
ncbi:hypothetical protein BC830DRAFT_516514 [Chytriomyces sp. MP71]|nr:hypothetical protein BC830DRAFT_516514 [Chytriomyces sp. MP71]